MRLSIISLFLIMGLSAFGQVTNPPPGQPLPPQPKPMAFVRGFRGVLVAGINGAQIDGDGLSGYYKPGFVGGFAAIFDVSPKISFGPEFLYSGKGARATLEQMEAGLPSINQRINYLEFPLLVHIRASRGFTITVGPSINALISAKFELGNGEGDNTSTFSKIDYGLSAGVEYVLLDQLSAAARMYYSVLPADAGGTTGLNTGQLIYANPGLRNNVISVMLRYYLIGGARAE